MGLSDLPSTCPFTYRDYDATLTTALAQKLPLVLADCVKLQSPAAPGDKLFFPSSACMPQHYSSSSPLSEARSTVMALVLASSINAKNAVVFHQDEVNWITSDW
jgi:hypothetical protein